MNTNVNTNTDTDTRIAFHQASNSCGLFENGCLRVPLAFSLAGSNILGLEPAIAAAAASSSSSSSSSRRWKQENRVAAIRVLLLAVMKQTRAATFLTLVAVTASATAALNASSTACNRLASLYSEFTLFPTSTNYTIQATDFWDKRSDLDPICIFLPENVSHVVSAVEIFCQEGAEFAVRGGGHMNNPGSNNIDNGILMSLSGLSQRTVSVNGNQSTIAVGPGNSWFDVYAALDPYGLDAIGGRLKTIGVPGLTLIGGFHYFNNKYGWTMDNVDSYDVVLGNGTLITANRSSYNDLFWSLKGGANNFGIVTNFVLRAYEIPKISIQAQVWNESAVPDFIKAVCDFAENDDALVGAGSVISIQYNATTKVVSPSLLGVQEGTESPPSRFAQFAAIPAVQTVQNVTTPLQWASTLDTPNQMFRVQFAHHTMKPDADQLYKMYQIWKDAVDQIADVQGLYPTFVMNVMPKSANTIAKTNGVGNTWGLDDDQSWILFQTSTGWDLPEDDLRITAWSKSLIEHLHNLNKEKGIASEFLYMGDAGEFQDPFAAFPAENVERMKAIRSKYDPNKVFQRLNWGGFKLGF
ncbi:FAD binding domain-containing protein [Cladophialophora immunda]|nr:FAD binding domain-containing protein [Cladophialophora immunda]